MSARRGPLILALLLAAGCSGGPVDTGLTEQSSSNAPVSSVTPEPATSRGEATAPSTASEPSPSPSAPHPTLKVTEVLAAPLDDVAGSQLALGDRWVAWTRQAPTTPGRSTEVVVMPRSGGGARRVASATSRTGTVSRPLFLGDELYWVDIASELEAHGMVSRWKLFHCNPSKCRPQVAAHDPGKPTYPAWPVSSGPGELSWGGRGSASVLTSTGLTTYPLPDVSMMAYHLDGVTVAMSTFPWGAPVPKTGEWRVGVFRLDSSSSAFESVEDHHAAAHLSAGHGYTVWVEPNRDASTGVWVHQVSTGLTWEALQAGSVYRPAVGDGFIAAVQNNRVKLAPIISGEAAPPRSVVDLENAEIGYSFAVNGNEVAWVEQHQGWDDPEPTSTVLHIARVEVMP